MLIDQFLPRHDFHEIHSIDIDASAEKIYRRLQKLDLTSSFATRVLFLLRGMPSSCLTLEGLLKRGFVVLAEESLYELVLGVIGKFWSPRGGLVEFEPSSFTSFQTPGYAKAAWNFSLAELSPSSTCVTTQTRIVCTDEQSRRNFRAYWLVVHPFSSIIRKEILKTLKRQVEQSQE